MIYCGINCFPFFPTKHKKVITYILVDVVFHFGIENLVKNFIILIMLFTYKKSNCKEKNELVKKIALTKVFLLVMQWSK
jgi:hypothetical protein